MIKKAPLFIEWGQNSLGLVGLRIWITSPIRARITLIVDVGHFETLLFFDARTCRLLAATAAVIATDGSVVLPSGDRGITSKGVDEHLAGTALAGSLFDTLSFRVVGERVMMNKDPNVGVAEVSVVSAEQHEVVPGFVYFGGLRGHRDLGMGSNQEEVLLQAKKRGFSLISSHLVLFHEPAHQTRVLIGQDGLFVGSNLRAAVCDQPKAEYVKMLHRAPP